MITSPTTAWIAKGKFLSREGSVYVNGKRIMVKELCNANVRKSYKNIAFALKPLLWKVH